MELASLSDLLGLEGLKEVTTYALRTNYCHNFHKVKQKKKIKLITIISLVVKREENTALCVCEKII